MLKNVFSFYKREKIKMWQIKEKSYFGDAEILRACH